MIGSHGGSSATTCTQQLNKLLVTHPVSRWKGRGPSNPLMCVITFRPAAPSAAATAHQNRPLLVATMSISTTTQGSSGERRRRPPPEAGEDDKAAEEDAAMAAAAPPMLPYSLVRPVSLPASLVVDSGLLLYAMLHFIYNSGGFYGKAIYTAEPIRGRATGPGADNLMEL